MLKRSKYLVIMAHYLEFENKKLIKALKTEKKKQNRDKKLNLLNEKNDNL